jgi:aspartyl-tRNA(Asn)/glutamyl-tRNA(Gln) amidotransferase subunit C
MSVDAQTVKRIAHLARLKIEEADVAPLQAELNGILGWIEQLNEVDVTSVQPMTVAVAMKLPMRADQITDGGVQEDVLKNAPQAEFGFFAVPKVIE